MASAKGLTPVSANSDDLRFQTSCWPSEPSSALCLSSSDIVVSQGDIDAQRVSSNTLCLGMAQSYLELKLHITTTISISLFCDTALNTLRAMPELPVPGTCCGALHSRLNGAGRAADKSGLECSQRHPRLIITRLPRRRPGLRRDAWLAGAVPCGRSVQLDPTCTYAAAHGRFAVSLHR